MHYIGLIQIRQFYISVLRARGVCDERPLVVMADEHVLDACDAALDLGVELGMCRSEAQAVMDGRGTVWPYREQDYRDDQEKWLDVLTFFTDVIEPGLPHEAWVDLSDHPRPFEIQGRILRRVKKNTGLDVEIHSARCRWVARLASLVGDDRGLALFCPQMFIADQPTSGWFSWVIGGLGKWRKFRWKPCAGSSAMMPMRSILPRRAMAILMFVPCIRKELRRFGSGSMVRPTIIRF
jgi:hypothetical protein